MNYIVEIKAFQDLVQVKQLSTGQIALWYSLMYTNNKCAWIEWFTVPNMMLELNSGLSKSGIYKARNVLKQYGIIDFKTNGTKATSYKLFSLSNTTQSEDTRLDSNQESNQAGNRDSNRASVPRSDSNRDSNQGSNQGGNRDSNRSSNPLNKLNKTKLNDINNNNTEQEKVVDKIIDKESIDKEFSELVKLYQNCIGQPNGLTADWIESLKSEFGFEWVKNAMLEAEGQGVRTKAYVTRILSNWKTWRGMKLSTDKANNQNRGIPAAKKTRFHTAESRTDKYNNDQLEDAMTRKRREYTEKMKSKENI